MNFLTSATFSATASPYTVQKLTTSLDDQLSTDALVIVGRAIYTSTDGAIIQLQLSTGGTVDSGSHYAFAVNQAPYSSGTQANVTQSAGTTQFNLMPAIATHGTSLTSSFVCYIWSPFEATSCKNMTVTGTVAQSTTTGAWVIGGGTWSQTSQVDGFSLLLSAGAFGSGQVSVYQLVGQ